jgi:hypothetical protein
MIHAICVAGARPNLIKIKPVIDGLESLGAKTTFVHTGQHYDEAMSGVFLDDLGLRQPDRSLGVGSGTHAEQTARVMVAFEHAERIQRMMRAALGPEPIGEAEEVLLVDGVEHLDDCPLEDLVLQRGDAERPLPPSAFGMYTLRGGLAR